MAIRSSGSETTSVPAATLDDLDVDAFDAWLRTNAARLAADDVPREDALIRLRLAASMGPRIHPTIAGLYTFGIEPQFFLPQLTVLAVKFDGTEITSAIEARDDIRGPLPALVEGATAFVEEHARQLVNQVEPSQSTSEFPMVAFHEALVNALVHRDLQAGSPVAVRMFDNRLEVWSPGPASGLPENIDVYVNRGGISLPRNPLLALVARQMGLAEQLGRGLPLMRTAVEEEAHGTLKVEGSKEGVLVTIPSALDVHASQAELLAN